MLFLRIKHFFIWGFSIFIINALNTRLMTDNGTELEARYLFVEVNVSMECVT